MTNDGRWWLCVVAISLPACTRVPEPAPTPAPSASAPATSALRPSAIEMVLVHGGEFAMGSTDEVDSQPVHQVRVSGDFLMDRHEVTQEVYERLMGANPSRRKGAKNPVERVRWTDALKFCNARSKDEGLTPCYDVAARTCDFAADGYRLPTEAEWESACRAGADKLEDYAWFKSNSRRTHHPVAEKKANALGLYDLLGNVREWCHDYYQVDYYAQSPAVDPRGPAQGDKAVLRGGAFSSTATACTATARYCDDPGFTDACVASDDYGFRCVRRAPPAP